jgi:hypothetical protein
MNSTIISEIAFSEGLLCILIQFVSHGHIALMITDLTLY